MVRVALTDDANMGDVSTVGQFQNLPDTQVVDYLNQNPRHAAVVDRGEEFYVGVFRGASDAADNFYIAALPMEDPNDADGGDWTADVALAEALNY